MTVTADALDLLAGDPPRTRQPGDFQRHPTTGAPYVNHPTTGKRVMYGRPSSFGAALDNPFNLVKWKERQLLIGVSALDVHGCDIDPDDRDQLDKLAARCHDAAGSHLAADQGTHIHRLCEQYDKHGVIDKELFLAGSKLGIPIALQGQIVVQWAEFRQRLGLTALAVEQTVVNDRWRLAGTLDRLDVADRDHLTAYGILEAGVPFVGDIKTGGLTLGNDGQPNYWVKYPVQLAAYVDAVPYDTDTDERLFWDVDIINNEPTGQPNPHIALIYHYDLARALAGEIVDWQAIPVNVDAGREGGDLCRAAADFAKRHDLFAMPAPSKIAAPVIPATVTQQVADPEPIGLVPVPGPAANALLTLDAAHLIEALGEPGTFNISGPVDNFAAEARRVKLRARIADLVGYYVDGSAETLLRRYWPEGVPTLKHVGHTDDQLAQILAAVRRVEAEVGAGWHPDDGPPPHVNTDHPTAEVAYPTPTIDEGPMVADPGVAILQALYDDLTDDGRNLCSVIGAEAKNAGRSISVHASPTVRRWSIARAVIAWAASGRTVDEMWMAAGLLATHAQCCDADATLGGLISQFTIEQADHLYDAAHAAK